MSGKDKIEIIDFHLRIPRDVLDGVRSVADQESRSVNNLIVYWLRQCLKPYEAAPPKD